MTPLIVLNAWLQTAGTVVGSFLFPTICQCVASSFQGEKESEFYTDFTEVPLQRSSGVSENNHASFQSDVNIFWNVSSLIAEIVFILKYMAKSSNDLVWMYCFNYLKGDIRKTAEYMWLKLREEIWTEDVNLGVISI